VKARKQKPQVIYTYTVWDVLLANPTEPMPDAWRRHQLTRMWEGLHSIELEPTPTTDDWCVCSDAVNLMETLVVMGHIEDTSGLLEDAVAALAKAGMRSRAGQALRLDAPGIQAIRGVLEDYSMVLEALPERVMKQAHRQTERRIYEIIGGKVMPHDVRVRSVQHVPADDTEGGAL
jgi:hypothetical protein